MVFKTGILISLKMIHLYQNMLKISPSYSYIISTVDLVDEINRVH
jgi:hypothetical protein